MHPRDILIEDFNYTLPVEKIAAFPLPARDASKLLIYKNGDITEDTYQKLATHLPEKSFLVFNDTRVIPARILFQKATGGIIEIFCLEPYEETGDYSVVMNKKERVQWKCMIGGAGKWKKGVVLTTLFRDGCLLEATLIEKLIDAYVIEFAWQPAHLNFGEIIEEVGQMPLPPYIKRKAADADKLRYQTIYAKSAGSVAAPTAGLHFTEEIFSSFHNKNITTDRLTLHVGAGTFKPVKSASLAQHEMHAEWIEVTAANLQKLVNNLPNCLVAVGTTSLRTIESLYWMGVKTILFPNSNIQELVIRQWDVYEEPLMETSLPAAAALAALLAWMKANGLEKIITQTQILIAPGYRYKVAKALITNFHQPRSTLLLLVAAAIGNDWKKVYQYAMENDFRFLSYGDGSLLYLADAGI